MQRFLVEKKPENRGSAWGDIHGVRLTKVDEEEQYASESLAAALESNYGGRHVARIAQLYFARVQSLPQADLEVHVISLVKKVLGPSPVVAGDWGWLGSVAYLQALPRSLKDEITRDLESTFNKDKWPSEEQKAFRVFQLLDPQEPQNLFTVIYCRPNSLFQYLFPMSDLPPRTEELLKVWVAGSQDVYVPSLYRELCGNPPRISEGYLQVDLADWFTLRFVNWYVGNLARNLQSTTSAGAPQVSKIEEMQRCDYLTVNVGDIMARNPGMEILMAYLETFLPHSGVASGATKGEMPPRSQAIFRWAIQDLWFNRVKTVNVDPWVPSPTKRQLHAVFLLLAHIASDPNVVNLDYVGQDNGMSLLFREFKLPLLNFFIHCLNETPFESDASLNVVVDLWNVYLSPWKSAERIKRVRTDRPADRLGLHTGPKHPVTENPMTSDKWFWFVIYNCVTYLTLFQKTLERLDQESNPSLASLEALAGVFRDDGPLSPPVLFVLDSCDRILREESGISSEHTSSLSLNIKDSSLISNKMEDHRSAINKILQEQLQELNGRAYKVQGHELSALSTVSGRMKDFVRELSHKRKNAHHSIAFPIPVHLGSTVPVDCERICAIFRIKPDSGSHKRVPSSRVPEAEWKEGKPSWIRSAAQTFRFRALTKDGRKQLLSGTLESPTELAAQYIGDFSRRPVDIYEVPFLVRLTIVLTDVIERASGLRVEFRFLADSRNLIWILIPFGIFSYTRVSVELAWWIFQAIIFVIGAGNLRGNAGRLWNLVFALIWLDSSIKGIVTE